MPIQEIIVVEGTHDSALLTSILDCETIVTHGSTVSKTTQKLIIKAAQSRGIIIFTDPDSAGERIRRQITKLVPNAKHAFLPRNLALGKGKVGVEHASPKDILEALENVQTFCESSGTLTMMDLMELRLSGHPDSETMRKKVSQAFHIGDCNAKTFLKRCDMLKIDRKQLEDKVEELWKNR